ncbi:hypothetical protein BaRGS_00039358 [Batillaria attramentaria]|uniref:Uncharacterized protein n=1 Tax=Batillaria attramentaria TaxID=370345 RepID=A0ABD0J3C0_9CAEN
MTGEGDEKTQALINHQPSVIIVYVLRPQANCPAGTRSVKARPGPQRRTRQENTSEARVRFQLPMILLRVFRPEAKCRRSVRSDL